MSGGQCQMTVFKESTELLKSHLKSIFYYQQELKKNGYIVSLVPPQSYFDVQCSEFSHNIYLPPADPWHQEFHYTGRNVYSYWVAKYGTTRVQEVLQFEDDGVGDTEQYNDLSEWELVKTKSDHVVVSPEYATIHQGKNVFL